MSPSESGPDVSQVAAWREEAETVWKDLDQLSPSAQGELMDTGNYGQRDGKCYLMHETKGHTQGRWLLGGPHSQVYVHCVPSCPCQGGVRSQMLTHPTAK